MFDIGLDTNAEILNAKNAIEAIEKQGRNLRGEEEKEWKKFYDLVNAMHRSGCDKEKITTVGSVTGWVEYQTDRFIVVYDIHDVYIFTKVYKFGPQKWWKKLFNIKPSVEKVIAKKAVYLNGGYGSSMSLQEIDYNYIADYEQLFKEMTVYYVEFLKNKVHETQAEVEFRKLVQFA